MSSTLSNAVRLMLGTLTRIPVPPPSRVDRAVAGWSLALAPLGGALLAGVLIVPWWLLTASGIGSPPLVVAVLAVGAVAALTRAMHLDGLADTADGLGSGRSGEAALTIMKQSDIGPFGVVTLLIALLLQVAALTQLLAIGPQFAAAALLTALVLSRFMLAPLGTGAFPPARRDGLGQAVAASVTPALLGIAALLAAVAIAVGLLVTIGYGSLGNTWVAPLATADAVLRLTVAGVAGIVAGLWTATTARTRFGGVTGDVYGAVVETTATTVLVVAAIAAY
ncbi:adenosylcobinamide-GDP ribazoletransferase [Nocardioides dubius]|uniref:Adenosylcobinamide-GDP ribazoletransferase n=1 Tax=Nocardioides dubius TaxID=317019 RepID=A0ABN1U1D1_9ACTN